MTKILVIDDDIAINELIKINLELQGYEVLQAFNGTEGFALAKQETPQLIVLISRRFLIHPSCFSLLFPLQCKRF